MKLSYINQQLISAKKALEKINTINYKKREENQRLINIAYNTIDNLNKKIVEEYKKGR